MNITVIGAGAMGSLFGALLAEAGKTVTLLDIRREHVDAVNANGLSIEKAGARRIVPIQATTDPDRIRSTDLSIVFVKSPHTAAAAETAARLSGNTGVVLLINVGINAITALVGIKNGQILELEWSRQLSCEAVEEAMAVARAQNVAIDGDPVALKASLKEK
ncbi:MAG: NAD(P)-binding protein [Desulfosarcina sp.]|nr:NAD(P)-binding protein [Desulfosarcina sp.]